MKDVVPSKMQLKLENIQYLNPAFVAAVNQEIMEALRDCNNRPKLKAPRNLNILISFEPVVDTEGNDDAAFEVAVGYAVSPVARPKRVAPKSKIAINKQNQGFFHTDFPNEPSRPGMFDDEEVKKK